MRPKAQFSQARIVDCAFELARTEGLQRLSARTLAHRLGSSTSPIYTAFQTMAEIEDQVCERSTRTMLEYQLQPRTGSPLVDLCLGYLLFAMEERQLFQDMFLNKNELPAHSRQMRDFAFDQLMDKALAREDSLRGLPEDRRRELLEVLWTYTHGLAAQLNVGALALPDQPAIIAKLRRVIDPLLACLPR